MKTSIKVRDLTLKNILIILSYAALLVLGVIYFESIFQYLGELLNIIQPFIIGFILAFIFNIPMKFFEKKLAIQNKKKRRVVSAILSVLLILLVLLLVVMVVVPQVIENVRTLIDNLPSIFAQAEKWLNYVFEEIRLSPDLLDKINEFQTRFAQTFISTLTAWAPNIASGVSHITTSVINIFMGFVMAIYMIFSKDKLIRQVKKFAHALFNDQHYQYISEVVKLTGTTFENFLAGQLTESIIIGVLCYIGCMILDIPYASIAAIVIGFTNIIPYFGPIIGAVISSALILFVSPVKALIFLVFSTLLQQFESNLIYPHVVGNSVGLSALWVLFAVSVGGGLFGIPGMVFGLPTFSVIYELLRRWTNYRLEVKRNLAKKQEEIVE
ncbi:AI-2E family transporter [Massilimicrobiota timonensis]|uniref:AI-2E family transporter n=1 Tax=Massilimicrobiota timonensis TaxID=1776392 RepID=A0ABT7UIJ7_9FIRM|nr:AI-2E family transporter [Massilimicrobiota timonensis]MDM8195979.1 AI-2E family transporter [Massilimicrobiota timonensis]